MEVIDMTSAIKPGRMHKGRPAARLAKRLGLSNAFISLHIAGLDKVAASREISAKNKEFIMRFLGHISPEVSVRRLVFYTHKLRKLAAWLRKDFDMVDEDDMRSMLTLLSKGFARQDGGQYSLGTVHGYKVTLKRFYRWLEGDDQEYPRKVKWIKTNGDTMRIREPEQILTYEEVLEMIRHARNVRDKAIVSFLYESGARISEMLSMKIKHLEFTPAIVKTTLPVSKTRPRVIPLVACRQHLATWVNYHPFKDNPDAPVWSNLKRNGGEPLLSQTVNSILKRIASNAGIAKRVYPHLFRACSITHKQSAGWPEQAIKSFHGLSKDSKVMKHYSHLSYNDLEQIQRSLSGLSVEPRASPHGGIKCPRCGKMNPIYLETCECGLPTEAKAVTAGHLVPESELDARLEKKITEFLESRLGYDEFMERFLNALVRKARQSPAVMDAVGQISADLRGSHVRVHPSHPCTS